MLRVIQHPLHPAAIFVGQNLNKIGKVEIMDLLMEMEKGEVKELFSKNWLTHDAMWYGNCVFELGPEVANRLNKKTVRSMAAIEIKRIMKLMGILKEARINTFDELAEIIDTAFEVVRTRFMKFDFSFPEKNILHGKFHACFAHDGVKQFGMIETYECGILERVKGWLETIEVDYNMTPEFTGCLMHQKGSCEVDFHFALD